MVRRHWTSWYLIFDELHEMAHWLLAREQKNLTLQTTALVHEAYLRLVGDARVTARGRAYFFAAAARAMRQVLVDAARRRGASKRGGKVPIVSLDDDGALVEAYASELLDLNRALGRGSLDVSEVVDLAVQLAEGLSAAHRSGIIHCDIKPENLLMTRDGVLKIVDFGVAKVLRDGLASVGLPLGTAAYMSPEQTRGDALDHRTDLWSAGVVLYEMLAGARPFGGQGEALIHAIRGDPPQPLSVRRRDLPPALVAIVERCLEKEPGHRLDSADALARELRRASGDAAAIARPAGASRGCSCVTFWRSRFSWPWPASTPCSPIVTARPARSPSRPRPPCLASPSCRSK